MNAFVETGTKRDAQREATRARILAVARDHFERHGEAGASVRAIAKDAGVAAGTVLLHFTDKRDLLHASLAGDLDATIAHAVAMKPGRTLAASLRSIAHLFFAYYEKRPSLSKTLLREALLAEPPWRERFVAQVSRVHGHVAALATAAKARSELDDACDVAVLGASFFSFYYFALIGWVQGALADPRPIFDRMLATHLEALTPRTAKPKGRKPR